MRRSAPNETEADEDVAPASTDEPLGLARSRSTFRFWLGVLLVAASASAFAIAFRTALSAVLHAATGADDAVSAMRGVPRWARVCSPALGGLLAGVVGSVVARTPAGHGVGDVMEAVVLGRVRLSMRTTVLKSAASWLAIAFGGSLGREGPLIQFGGASGQAIAERLGLSSERARWLIAAGTAAGFASAYNTPFAAVLFVIEIVTGVVVLDAILPVVLATVVATAITQSVVGAGPIYGQRTFHLESPLEILAFSGLGVVTALAAQAFMRLLSAGESAFARGWLPLPWRPAFGGAVAGLVVAAIPEVAGNGYEPLNGLLDGGTAIGFVALLLVGKCFATTASVSSGSPGGVFTPTLLIGGSVGLLYAHALGTLGIATGPAPGYALVGMAAATAATTHAPLLAAVMVFELSGDYAVVLPLLTATAVATMVSRRLRSESVYAAELRRKGIRWELTMEGRRVVDP